MRSIHVLNLPGQGRSSISSLRQPRQLGVRSRICSHTVSQAQAQETRKKSLKESGDINKDSNSNSKGKNNGSPYEGGKDDEGNLGACDVFVAPDGEVTQAMCCDYGFRSGVGRLYQGSTGEVPKNFFALGGDNFAREFKQLRRSFRFNEYKSISDVNPPRNFVERIWGSVQHKGVQALATLDEKLEQTPLLQELDPNEMPDEVTDSDGNMTQDCSEVRSALRGLVLRNEDVTAYEHKRKEKEGEVSAPWPIRWTYNFLCFSLDILYKNRPIQRFWVLEVVARMPYFAYISMLHLYESLGWWRAGAELRRVHFAEEWNELHHLQIMESLGGDQMWWDRFLAQHSAIFYFWVLILFYTFAPRMAYVFSELVEHHAADTYKVFTDTNEDLLKSLPPPVCALEYYRGGDLYMFDAFMTTKKEMPRRPPCNTLYDVFVNVRDDEGEHVKTMTACADKTIVESLKELHDSPVKPMGGKKENAPVSMDEQKMDNKGSHL
ncbi:TPA: hypothetical protein ACH3X3_012597 [Trebouxia sp. C0006]